MVPMNKNDLFFPILKKKVISYKACDVFRNYDTAKKRVHKKGKTVGDIDP